MVFVRQTGSPQVYVVASGQLVHLPTSEHLAAYSRALGTSAGDLIVELPASAPIWQLAINGQSPGG